MASIISARTMEISSITSNSNAFINPHLKRCILRWSLVSYAVMNSGKSGRYGSGGSWKNELMVTPPALMAAIPVGATTTNFFSQVSCRFLRKVVLPVPALPVRKRDRLVRLIHFNASSYCRLSSMVIYKYNRHGINNRNHRNFPYPAAQWQSLA